MREFFLHIDEHGLEHRYKYEPACRSLLVTADDKREWTRTKNHEGVIVRPCGWGWELEAADESSSRWVRKVFISKNDDYEKQSRARVLPRRVMA
jgi:hypothetical protein